MIIDKVAAIFVDILRITSIFISIIYLTISFLMMFKILPDIIESLYFLYKIQSYGIFRKSPQYWYVVEDIKKNFNYFFIFFPGFLIFILLISKVIGENFNLIW